VYSLPAPMHPAVCSWSVVYIQQRHKIRMWTWDISFIHGLPSGLCAMSHVLSAHQEVAVLQCTMPNQLFVPLGNSGT
jgi:hypothetical protein